MAPYDVSDLISMFDRTKPSVNVTVELGFVAPWIERDRVLASGKRVDGLADGVTVIFEDYLHSVE